MWAEGTPERAEAAPVEAEERGRKGHHWVSLTVLALADKGFFPDVIRNSSNHVSKS